MKIINNPIDILLSVFEKEYPSEAKKINKIVFSKIDKGFGATLFNDDGSVDVFISPTLRRGKAITVEIAAELLAHELAHVIAGYEAEHGEVWEKHYDRLYELYGIEEKNIMEGLKENEKNN